MEKKFKNGLVLGKFMPPHKGHLHLINTALEQCENVFVLICSLESEPIKGVLRYNWLKMIYADVKNIKIIHVTDELPQHPDECASKYDFYIKNWCPVVIKHAPILDVVFTSEEYGDEFAEYLCVEHVLVDIDRVLYHTSGTKVRSNPIQEWDYIPDIVKEYYTKRIAIMGPESTGKSILTRMLAEVFETLYVKEHGRTYIETVKPSLQLEKEDFYNIALMHDEQLLNAHIECLRPWIFSDTEAITTKLFGEMYLGDDFKEERIDEIIKYQWFDLYILLDIDVPWIDDGTRDFPHPLDRRRHFNKIKNELDRLGRKYVVINGGDYNERFEKAREIINSL